MSHSRLLDLAAAPYTYAEVGATALPAELPPGYRHVRRSRTLARASFDQAAERLMTWRVHRDAGLAVAASSPRVAPDVVVELRLLGLRIPCRVVYVIEEPDRIGFAYGTLPGHPESGEERFVVEQAAAGTTFGLRAFSRPATALARIGGPATRWMQDRMAERYLSVLAR